MEEEKTEEKPPIQTQGIPSEQAREEEDPSIVRLKSPSFQKRSFLGFFLVSLFLVCHWFLTSDLFEVPEDVVETRNEFVKAKESYLSNPSYWDAKLRYFKEAMHQELGLSEQAFLELVQETPGEIFISFLLQHLNFSLDRLEQISAYPRTGSFFCISISKPESGLWPLKIMLSMEIEVKYVADKFSLAISRLRRGSQDIALGLAWVYFGPELDLLRALETKAQQIILVTTKD